METTTTLEQLRESYENALAKEREAWEACERAQKEWQKANNARITALYAIDDYKENLPSNNQPAF